MIASWRPSSKLPFLRSPLRSGCCFVASWSRLAALILVGWLLTGCGQPPDGITSVSASGLAATATADLEQLAARTHTDAQPVDNLPGSGAAPGNESPATPPAGLFDPAAPAVGLAGVYPTALPMRSPSVPVSDLLYLSEGRLLRWSPPELVPQQLAENVQTFALTSDGRLAALLRPRRIAINGQQRFDLELLDLQTLQTASLLKESPPLLQINLSPDGSWLAYRVDVEGGPIYALPISDLRQAIAAAATPTAAHSPTPATPVTFQKNLGGLPGGPTIEAVPRPPVRLGACDLAPETNCDQLDWSPLNPGALLNAAASGSTLIWSDHHGIWLTNPAQPIGQPRLIQPAEITVADPKGQKSQMQVVFSQPTWSPQGRFILARVQPLNSPISWYTLVDTLSGRLADIRDSYSQSPNQAQARWLPNGDLLVTHASDPARQVPPYVRLIQARPTSPDLLVIGKAFELYSDALPFTTSARKIIPIHQIAWAGDPYSGRMPLEVRLVGVDATPVLFLLDLQFGKLEKLTDLPSNIAAIHWSPDGSGGLMTLVASSEAEAGSATLFVALDGSGFYDLQTILGPNPHQFHWLPPLRPNG